MNRELIAISIINYLKKKNKTTFTVRYTKNYIINPKTNENYSQHQLSNGTRWLREKGLIKRASKTRWEVVSFDLTPTKLNNENTICESE